MDLHLSISYSFVFSKIYDKRDDFDFDTVFFSFLDDDVPSRSSYGMYIYQLIRFARVCSHVEDFNLVINIKLLNFSNRIIGIISLGMFFQVLSLTL